MYELDNLIIEEVIAAKLKERVKKLMSLILIRMKPSRISLTCQSLSTLWRDTIFGTIKTLLGTIERGLR